jgi:hypothetical protein
MRTLIVFLVCLVRKTNQQVYLSCRCVLFVGRAHRITVRQFLFDVKFYPTPMLDRPGGVSRAGTCPENIWYLKTNLNFLFIVRVVAAAMQCVCASGCRRLSGSAVTNQNRRTDAPQLGGAKAILRNRCPRSVPHAVFLFRAGEASDMPQMASCPPHQTHDTFHFRYSTTAPTSLKISQP